MRCRALRPCSTSVASALRKVFGGKVSYRKNGEPCEGNATEALALRALQLGMAGPQRAKAAALELAAKYGVVEEAPGDEIFDSGGFSEEELCTLGRLLARAQGELFDEPPPSSFDTDNFCFDSMVKVSDVSGTVREAVRTSF